MRVVLRADASVTIGTGHVMRCLTLANALRARGAECHFITRDLPGHLGAHIAQQGHEVSLLNPPDGPAPEGPPDHAGWAGVTWQVDLAETRAVMGKADWLVVDHYAFDARWQRELKDLASHIMVIDDLADRPHVASLLLDQNLGRVGSDYDELVPPECHRLIGPRFALLRPEFAAQRAASLARREHSEVSHLMITMGGTDAIDATSSVLRALQQATLPNDLRISVVMGSRAPALDSVRAFAKELPWKTEVLVDVRDMAGLMSAADLAIGAGGSTTWERCCLGLPGIIVETAENQSGAVAAMVQAHATLGVGPLSAPGFGARLIEALEQLMDPEANTRLSQRSSELCAGDGVTKVAHLMENIA